MNLPSFGNASAHRSNSMALTELWALCRKLCRKLFGETRNFWPVFDKVSDEVSDKGYEPRVLGQALTTINMALLTELAARQRRWRRRGAAVGSFEITGGFQIVNDAASQSFITGFERGGALPDGVFNLFVSLLRIEFAK